MSYATAAHDDHALPSGWSRYVYSTNHKDIGTMYLVFAIIAGVIGGFLSIMMRIELAEPGIQIFPWPGAKWSMARYGRCRASMPASTCTTCSSPATACS